MQYDRVLRWLDGTDVRPLVRHPSLQFLEEILDEDEWRRSVPVLANWLVGPSHQELLIVGSNIIESDRVLGEVIARKGEQRLTWRLGFSP